MTTSVTPAELFAHPEWIGTTVTVELREDLLDETWSSGAPKGGYDVEVMDLGAQRLRLVPAGPGEAGMATIAKVVPPVRVVGTLKQGRFGLDVVPSAIEQLAFEAPIKLGSAAEILKQKSGTVVEVTGEWTAGDEASLLDGDVWVSGYRNEKRICEPTIEKTPPGGTRARVRIIGLVYVKAGFSPGNGYGHLNMRQAEIKAIEMEWLSPRDPACK